MQGKRKAPHLGKEPNLWLSSLISGGIGLVVTLMLVLLAPMLLLGMDDPNSFILPIAILCIFAGGATAGVMAAMLMKGDEVLSALISAGVILIPVVLVSLLFEKGFDIIGFLIILAALAISDMLGAYVVVKINSSQKRSMKNAMKRR